MFCWPSNTGTSSSNRTPSHYLICSSHDSTYWDTIIPCCLVCSITKCRNTCCSDICISTWTSNETLRYTCTSCRTICSPWTRCTRRLSCTCLISVYWTDCLGNCSCGRDIISCTCSCTGREACRRVGSRSTLHSRKSNKLKRDCISYSIICYSYLCLGWSHS